MILIVEDEAKIARFVQLELEHEGYEVRHIADGRTALESAVSHDYDLIILDLMLPGLNGIELLRRLRQVKETPVIILTARDQIMDKVAGLDIGANDYMTKPFSLAVLRARIEALMRRSGGRRQTAYTEFYCTDVLWPDFTKEDLMKAVEYYNSRERRFGGV